MSWYEAFTMVDVLKVCCEKQSRFHKLPYSPNNFFNLRYSQNTKCFKLLRLAAVMGIEMLDTGPLQAFAALCIKYNTLFEIDSDCVQLDNLQIRQKLKNFYQKDSSSVRMWGFAKSWYPLQAFTLTKLWRQWYTNNVFDPSSAFIILRKKMDLPKLIADTIVSYALLQTNSASAFIFASQCPVHFREICAQENVLVRLPLLTSHLVDLRNDRICEVLVEKKEMQLEILMISTGGTRCQNFRTDHEHSLWQPIFETLSFDSGIGRMYSRCRGLILTLPNDFCDISIFLQKDSETVEFFNAQTMEKKFTKADCCQMSTDQYYVPLCNQNFDGLCNTQRLHQLLTEKPEFSATKRCRTFVQKISYSIKSDGFEILDTYHHDIVSHCWDCRLVRPYRYNTS